MKIHSELYGSLGKILNYPFPEYRKEVETCRDLLARLYPNEEEKLQQFLEYISYANRASLEELYVHTFDVHAICCLDVGYAIFGEDYKRGQFMAQIKRLLREHKIDCESELPDYLPNILRLLVCLDFKNASQLVSQIIIPAIDKMLQGFKEDGNVYRYPLETIRNILKRDFRVH